MARWLGNSNKMEVHDLENERVNCQIDEIKPEHREPFRNHVLARAAGYDNCAWCIGESTR